MFKLYLRTSKLSMKKALPIISVLIILTGIVVYFQLLTNEYVETRAKEDKEEKELFIASEAQLQQNQVAFTSLDSLQKNVANPELDDQTNFIIAKLLCEKCYEDTVYCVSALLQTNFILSKDSLNKEVKELRKTVFIALGDSTQVLQLK
jgi:hypothetical protein